MRMVKYIKGRFKSFKYAFKGIQTLSKEELNAQIQAAASIAALIMGYWLRISAMEWIIICTVIGLVFAMEAINTAIENLADHACNKEIHPTIKKIKDLSAAAVLLTAIIALIAGLIIFLPKLLTL